MNRHVPLVYAHRGASAEQPENTLAAFRLAAEQGADGVELDVRITASGELVLAHDPVYPDGSPVYSTPPDARPGSVPTLAEALDECLGMLVNVELKNSPGDLGEGVPHGFDVVERVGDLVLERRAAHPEERILVSSFDRETLAVLRRNYPGIDAALLTVDLGLDSSVPEEAAEAGFVALHPWDPLVDEQLAQRCDSLGLALNVWTVNDPERIATLAKLGAAGVITDLPAMALTALGRA